MINSPLKDTELKGALRHLIVLADDNVASKRVQLQALRSSHSDQNAIAALIHEIDKLSSAADRLRPLTN